MLGITLRRQKYYFLAGNSPSCISHLSLFTATLKAEPAAGTCRKQHPELWAPEAVVLVLEPCRAAVHWGQTQAIPQEH